MTDVQIANALEVVSVLGLWSLVIFKILPTVRVDSFRQNMFSIRDRMFDFAAAGNIGFDDPAYLLLRQQMNGLIRFGHQLSVFRILLGTLKGLLIRELSETPSFQELWDAAIKKVENEEVRRQLVAFHDQSRALAMKYLVMGSPSLWPLLFTATIVFALRGAAKGIRQLVRISVKRVLIGPLDASHIEQAATNAHLAW